MDTPLLYDYISLKSDSSYSKFITVESLMELLIENLGCEKKSNASCYFIVEELSIGIQGIVCDTNGNYSFHSDESFEKINLIEINLPQGSESKYETEIISFTKALADSIKWEIDWER
jgi:hypothetical protein